MPSVVQVHEATLRPEFTPAGWAGRRVAVKVQRQGIGPVRVRVVLSESHHARVGRMTCGLPNDVWQVLRQDLANLLVMLMFTKKIPAMTDMTGVVEAFTAEVNAFGQPCGRRARLSSSRSRSYCRCGFSQGCSRQVVNELDFEREVGHQEYASSRLVRHATAGYQRVLVPKVHPQVCQPAAAAHGRVAVFRRRRGPLRVTRGGATQLRGPKAFAMEFVPGLKLTGATVEALSVGERTRVMSAIIDAFASMIYLDGEFHCDPHPGNLVRKCTASSRLVRYQICMTRFMRTIRWSCRATTASAGRCSGRRC